MIRLIRAIRNWLNWVLWGKYRWNRLLNQWAEEYNRNPEANQKWISWGNGKPRMSDEEHAKLLDMFHRPIKYLWWMDDKFVIERSKYPPTLSEWKTDNPEANPNATKEDYKKVFEKNYGHLIEEGLFTPPSTPPASSEARDRKKDTAEK